MIGNMMLLANDESVCSVNGHTGEASMRANSLGGRSEELPKERAPSTMPYRWGPPADYLPEPSDKKARLAIALHREALGLEQNNLPYAFLGFTKILNLGGDGKKQIEWINSEIGKLNDRSCEGAPDSDPGKRVGCWGSTCMGQAASPSRTPPTIRLSIQTVLLIRFGSGTTSR